MGGTWDLGISCEVNPLFLVAMRSLRLLFPWFKAISSSSSSEVLSGRASPKSGREHLNAYQARLWRLRCELFEPLESPQVISVKRQISFSSDKREEAISSLGVAVASGKTC